MLMGGLLVVGFISTMFMTEQSFEPFYEFFQSKGMLFEVPSASSSWKWASSPGNGWATW